MIINGWKTTEDQAMWMGQTEPDPRGETHTIMVLVGCQQSPDPDLLDARNQEHQLPVAEPTQGMCLRLLLDGEPQALLEMGGDMDVPLDRFVRENPAQVIAELAVETVVRDRRDRARQSAETP